MTGVEHIPRKEMGVPVSRLSIREGSELPDNLRAYGNPKGRAQMTVTERTFSSMVARGRRTTFP
jgi:hypothetical protein